MKTALRTIGAFAASMLLAFILVIAVEFFGSVVHPFPEDFDGSHEEICRVVESYPSWVLAVIIPMWSAIAFCSTWLAQRLGNYFSSSLVGILLLLAVAFNLGMLPYPIWFKIGCLLAVPAASIAAIRVSSKSD